MGTKNQPGEFDCYLEADDDEPMFVLLARDPSAPELVEDWAKKRMDAMLAGEKPKDHIAKVIEAWACAEAMREWYGENR